MNDYNNELKKIDSFIEAYARYISDTDEQLESMRMHLDMQYSGILITFLNKKFIERGLVPTEMEYNKEMGFDENILKFLTDNFAGRLETTDLFEIAQNANKYFCNQILDSTKKISAEMDINPIVSSLKKIGISV